MLHQNYRIVLRIAVEKVVQISHYPATILLLAVVAEAVVTIMPVVEVLVVMVQQALLQDRP